MTNRHSLYHRLVWSPFVVAPFAAWWIYSVSVRGFTPLRVIGLIAVVVWFVLAALDLWTNHALLDGLYGDRKDEQADD